MIMRAPPRIRRSRWTRERPWAQTSFLTDAAGAPEPGNAPREAEDALGVADHVADPASRRDALDRLYGHLARRAMQRGRKPVPKQAIRNTKADQGPVFLREEECSCATVPLGNHPQLLIRSGSVGGEEADAVFERPLFSPDIFFRQLTPVAVLVPQENSRGTCCPARMVSSAPGSSPSGPAQTSRGVEAPVQGTWRPVSRTARVCGPGSRSHVSRARS